MIYNTGYEAIISGLLAVLIAQLLKLLTFYLKTGKIDFEYLHITDWNELIDILEQMI